jgi:hypothetical protein
MNIFLNKTMGLWAKATDSSSVGKAWPSTRLEAKAELLVQPNVPLMSLPYELLIQVMESVPIPDRSMTLSSFRL